jgi:hypothetical protein
MAGKVRRARRLTAGTRNLLALTYDRWHNGVDPVPALFARNVRSWAKFCRYLQCFFLARGSFSPPFVLISAR